MRTPRAAAAALAAVLLLAGCVSAATKQAAADLTSMLAAMPGVASVSRSFTGLGGTPNLRVTVVVRDGATAAQLTALARPVAASARGEHPLRQLVVKVRRATAPTGADEPSTLTLTTADTPSVVAPIARRFVELGSLIGDSATVSMATTGDIDVVAAADVADPVRGVAAALATYRDAGLPAIVVKTPGKRPRFVLSTQGVPTATIVTRWHSLVRSLVRLPGGAPTHLSQIYSGPRRSIRCELALPAGIAASDLTPPAYRGRLLPMIRTQLDALHTMDPSADYTLEYDDRDDDHTSRDDRDGQLVRIAPGVQGTYGAPAPFPAGWTDLALAYLSTLR